MRRRSLSEGLISSLDPSDLQDLRGYFSSGERRRCGCSRKPSLDDREISLTKSEFVSAIEQIFGKTHLNTTASAYFENLQKTGKIKESISWSQFLDSIIEEYQSKIGENEVTTEKLFTIGITRILSQEKDPIEQILPLDTEQTFSLVTLSYRGCVKVYSRDFTLQHTYDVPMSSGLLRRLCWVSSATSSLDGKNIFVSTSDRSLYFYDASRSVHGLKFIISDLPNVISCQHYSVITTTNEPILFLGDDSGNIHSMLFHQGSKSYFKKKNNNETTKYKWLEMNKQADWLSLTSGITIHQDYVMDIMYINEKDLVVSCSPDPVKSIVFRKRVDNSIISVIKLKKSIKCFDIDPKLGFLATSTSEPSVSLWTWTPPTGKIAKLSDHESSIIDVRFLSQSSSLLTLSADWALKVWSLEYFKCVQSLNLGSTLTFRRTYFIRHKIALRKAECFINKSIGITRSQPVRNIYITNGILITELLLDHSAKLQHEKPMPPKNLVPAIPRPEILLKNYNREYPFDLKNGFDEAIKGPEIRPPEEAVVEKRFFLKNGAVYIGIRPSGINEEYINSISPNDLMRKVSGLQLTGEDK